VPTAGARQERHNERAMGESAPYVRYRAISVHTAIAAGRGPPHTHIGAQRKALTVRHNPKASPLPPAAAANMGELVTKAAMKGGAWR